MSRIRACALLCAVAVISACAGDETGSTSVPQSGPDTSAPTTSVPSTTSTSEATTTTNAPTTTTDTGAGGGESCIVGNWEVDTEVFLEQVFTEAGAEMPPMLESAVTEGSYTLEFSPDGTYRSVRDQFTIEGSGGGAGTLVFVVDADLEGTWSTSGDELTVDPGTGEVDVSAQMEVNGEVLEVPFDASETFGDQAIAGTGTYTCQDDELRVTFEGYTQTLHRVG